MGNFNNEKYNEIITNLIELIEDFSIAIYKREKDESYKLLIDIIDKLDIVINMKSKSILESKVNCIDKLSNKLPILLEAFENGDDVLISDILNYEIKPILKKLLK
ncbi:hypothetical protein [Clostridium sp.]|jgi:tRNA/tmRNA/rRNA uracil-C5-methylase (TrmA/RlmC/RlmD family)|uniref:hypothetical protein n=1 Tax=Clostridium sp. TaxID=1506 RepID=UPI002FDCE82A